MTEYLFLVPAQAKPKDGDWADYEGWTQASIGGVPLKTTITNHFSGKMPLILATEHIHYISLEDILYKAEILDCRVRDKMEVV